MASLVPQLTIEKIKELALKFQLMLVAAGLGEYDRKLCSNGEGFERSYIDEMFRGFLLGHSCGFLYGAKPLGYVMTKTGEKGEVVVSFSSVPVPGHDPVVKLGP